MKRIISVLLLLLVSQISSAQGPLSFEVTQIEVDTKVESIERTTLIFDGSEVSSTDKALNEKTVKTPAIRIVTSEPAESVQAFNTDFDLAVVLKITDSEYVLAGSPGKYLLAVDIDRRTKYRPVVIEPIEGQDPDPGNDLAELAKLSSDLASRVNDPPTRAALHAALTGILPELRDDLAVPDAARRTSLHIEKALFARSGDSVFKDWLGIWRRPIQKAMEGYKLTTVERYAKAVEMVAEGLKVSSVNHIPDVGKLVAVPEYGWRNVIVKENCANGQCIERVERRWVRIK